MFLGGVEKHPVGHTPLVYVSAACLQCAVHYTDVGSFVVANWYRPGASNDDSIHSLRVELQNLMSDNIRTIILEI